MRAFYDASDGERWDVDGSWTEDSVPVCEKKGVGCNSNGLVTEIRLRGLGISGTVPEAIGFLSSLEVLDLGDNRLYGALPVSLKFLPLRELDVGGNMMTSIPSGLCQKLGVNKNGIEGVSSCDLIACPIGTFNPTGRWGGQGLPCRPCSNYEFVGGKTCSISAWDARHMTSTDIGALAFLGAVTVGLLIVVYFRTRHSSSKYYDSVVRGGLESGFDMPHYDEINFSQGSNLSKQIPKQELYNPNNFMEDEDSVEQKGINGSEVNPLWLDVPAAATETSSARKAQERRLNSDFSETDFSVASTVGSNSGMSTNVDRIDTAGAQGEVWLDVPKFD